jgi:alkylhydroperoxidase/carboxymuconolactone decarboxylase family protein YurZ
MATLLPIQPNEANGDAKALFDGILQRLPRVPNMLAILAHSPKVLGSYLAFTESFNSQLPERLRDLISITVAQVTGGDYIFPAWLSYILIPIRHPHTYSGMFICPCSGEKGRR